MSESTALHLRLESLRLLEEAEVLLKQYIKLHDRLFSWKNYLFWSKFDDIKVSVPALLVALTDFTQQTKTYLQTAQGLPDSEADRPNLVEFYTLLNKYFDFLRQAVQVMERLVVQVEARARKTVDFKQKVYEADLAIYKQKVDKYQLYGQELNTFIARLSGSSA
jgi:hypothetical protein